MVESGREIQDRGKQNVTDERILRKRNRAGHDRHL